MSTDSRASRFHHVPTPLLALTILTLCVPLARSQQRWDLPAPSPATAGDDATPAETPPADGNGLPEAPSAIALGSSSSVPQDIPPAQPAFHTSKTGTKYADASPVDLIIFPGQIAPTQTVRNKLIGSVLDTASPFSFAGEIVSSGYSHLANGSPNYGTNSSAYGQRFGAAVARNTSQKLFSEGVLASLLHEDPRYYQMGNRGSKVKRVGYAITRPLVTRTDGGRSTPNLSLLGGYLGAAALTKVYYPPLNQGFEQTLATFGGSLGGAALGNVATEFFSDAAQRLHLKHN